MVELVSLSLVKEHLKIDQNSEDSVLAVYIAAAEQDICNYINQPIPGISDSPATEAPAAIKAAALLIVGDLYENREGAVLTKTGTGSFLENPAVIRLIQPYRIEIGI